MRLAEYSEGNMRDSVKRPPACQACHPAKKHQPMSTWLVSLPTLGMVIVIRDAV